VTKVLLSAKRAVGVEFIDENGETKTVRARKEVRTGFIKYIQLIKLE
jgi:hypothetical protein